MSHKVLIIFVAGILAISLMSSFSISMPSDDLSIPTTVFNTVYQTPEYPFGHEWDTGDGQQTYTEGWGGDVITVYADVALDPQTKLYIKYDYCNEMACFAGEPGMGDDLDFRNSTYVLGWEMNYVSGTLYSYTLIGDWMLGYPTYPASTYSGIHVGYTVYAKNTTDGSVVVGEPYYDMYPYWPASQINVTSSVSKTVLDPGEDFWVNGSANYFHRLNWHDQPPADHSDVTVSVNPVYQGTTDASGNFSLIITAPMIPGIYSVNTTVSNATYNRNVTSVCDDVQIDVISLANYSIDVLAGWNLISVPLTLASGALPAALLDMDSDTLWDVVQWCDPSGQWRTYSVYQPPVLIDLTSIDIEMGLWVHVTDPGDYLLRLEGTEPSITIIDLYAGWNLVGYPTLNDTVALSDALWGTSADKAMVFDPAEPYLVKEVGPAYIMQPGEGYWIHVLVDTTWMIDW